MNLMHGEKMTKAGGKQKSCVFRLRLKVSIVGDVRIARGIEFQMTEAAERNEREPKLVVDGVGT